MPLSRDMISTRNGENSGSGEEEMAKRSKSAASKEAKGAKRPKSSTSKEAKGDRGDKHKYFPKDFYVGSLEQIMLRFDRALSDLNLSRRIGMLDQGPGMLTKQSGLNLIMLWFAVTVEKHGAEAAEKHLLPVVDELNRIVAQSMRERGREIDPAFLPEGFSLPKKRGTKKGGPKARKRPPSKG